MSKTQWAFVFGALFVVAVLLYVVVGGDAPSAPDDDEREADERTRLLESETAAEPVAGLKGAAREEPSERERLPAPVDLKKVDRERDLHGIVVRADDSPVAGANLRVLYYPWRHGRLLTDGEHNMTRAGPSSRSARDGTFAVRLSRGDHVHLEVAADGLATTEYTMLQAGEFLRVVLQEPVRLIVKAKTPAGAPAAGLELRIFRRGRSAIGFERKGVTGEDGCFVFEDLPPGGSVYLDPRPRSEGWGDPGWITVQLPAKGEVTHEFTLPDGRTLRGTVTDKTTGKPIEGARVGMNWVLTPEVRTGADGRYELHGWSGKGVSDIHVLAEGYGRDQVDVEAKEVLDFELLPGSSARGRVLDPGGKPVDGAQIMAVASDHGPIQRISMDDAWSDKDGRFLLTGLRREMTHVLTIMVRGYAMHFADIAPQPEQDEIDLGDIAMGPARVLVGVLQSSDKTPVPRVRINLRVEEQRGYRYGRAWERMSDDLGRFRFEDLPPGSYTVETRPQGGAGVSKKLTVLDRDEPTTVTLTQQSGREVRIRVTDQEGNPLDSVYLSAQVKGGRGVQGQTGKDGVAKLRLPPLPCTLQVQYFGERAFARPPPIELAADQTEATFVLAPAAMTTGTLLDPSGTPLAWATLEVHREGRERPEWVRTDAEGKFSVRTEIGVVFSIVFRGQVGSARGGLSAPKSMEGRIDGVRAGATGVVLRATALETGGSLRIRVLDPEGNPLENLWVSLSPMQPGSAPLRTDADGRVKAENLVVRKMQVGVAFGSTAEQPWLAPRLHDVLPQGQELVMRMRVGSPIEGMILNKDGKPLRGSVMVMRDEKFVSSAMADEDGRFVAVVDPADEGPYTLRSYIHGSDRRTSVATVDGVRPGATGVVLRHEAPK